MAARIIANLLVAGGGVLFRAAAQAYRQAVVNAAKSGVTAENVSAGLKSGQMSLQEAQQILGVEKNATLEQARKKFEHLFKVNEEHGSFYLQSKVYRAKERLDQDFREKGIDVDAAEEAARAAKEATEAAEQGRQQQ